MRPTSALCAALLLGFGIASSALAQTAVMKRTGGVIGTSVTYEMEGGPGQIYLAIPSVTTGPTPLSLFDPLDPRTIDVGLELLQFWKLGLLSPVDGKASFTLPVPPSMGLQSVPLYALFLTLPGAPTTFDQISNRTAFRMAQAGTSTFTIGPRPSAIEGHSSTLLADGRVLMAGGISVDSLGNQTYLASFHVFDPQTQSFEPVGGTMQHGRAAHSATLLADGRVLLLGGSDPTGTIRATGDVWDPVTETCTPVPDMAVPRTIQTATLLNDGRVFVAGGLGTFDPNDPLGPIASIQASTQVYNPNTNSWQAGPNLPRPRVGHGASLLPDGRVLLTGGIEVQNLIIILVPVLSADCRRYDPNTNSLVSTASLSTARAFHGQITLSNGKALAVAGGAGDPVLGNVFTLSSCETYDASGNSWSLAAPLNFARGYPNVHEVGGRLVVLGGVASLDLTGGAAAPAPQIETAADLTIGAWTYVGDSLLPRGLPVSTAVDGGVRILTTGIGDNGSGGTNPDVTAELFVP